MPLQCGVPEAVADGADARLCVRTRLCRSRVRCSVFASARCETCDCNHPIGLARVVRDLPKRRKRVVCESS